MRIEQEAASAWLPRRDLGARGPYGVQTMAVEKARVAIVGGYGKRDRSRVALIDIGTDNNWLYRQTVQLALPIGRSLDKSIHVQGLNDTLHVFAGTNWYMTDLTGLRG